MSDRAYIYMFSYSPKSLFFSHQEHGRCETKSLGVQLALLSVESCSWICDCPSSPHACHYSMIVRPLQLIALLVSVYLPPSSFAGITSDHQHMLKKGILQQLGLTKEPDLAVPTLPVPSHVWKLYDDVLDDATDADFIRHFYPNNMLERNESLLLSYNLSRAVNDSVETVQRAVLKIRLQTRKSSGHVSVYATPPESDMRRPLDSIAIDPDRDWQWLDLDVSSIFVRHPQQLMFWLELPPTVELFTSPAHSIAALPFTKKQSASLIIYTIKDEPSRVRRKRSAPRGNRRKGRKGHVRLAPERSLCQRRDLFVDFEELNWQDWILAPKGYQAGQCSGLCPHPIPEHLNATNHAIIQSLLHSINPQIPPPCCVPTETSHLAILYMDVDNRIVIKNYPDMRVDACGCR